jgi:hypothetical protein
MSESVKIDQKIKAWSIKKEETEGTTLLPIESTLKVDEIPLKTMNEGVKREPKIYGSTTKIKSPEDTHSLYITINNQEVEQVLHPMEIFLNTKNPEHKVWTDALSLVLTAVFKKGGDLSFLADELETVQDSRGYWQRNTKSGKPKYVNSIVADLGRVIREHLEEISEVKVNTKLDDVYVEVVNEDIEVEVDDYPKEATVCKLCKHRAVIVLDKCPTCLQCGDSKCN